ncbi:MAG: UDP-N-acetylmuramate dehydrogenase [Thermodesulfobacteriota bacterium]
MSDFLNQIDKYSCEILEKFPMKKYLTLKVGGEAEVVVYPGSTEELIEILTIAYDLGIKTTVLGAGSNTIIKDSGIRNLVISTKKLKGFTINDNNTVLAECGSMMSAIMNKTMKMGLRGFEFAAGIPGTVGGGIYMNAGANGGEIKDIVEKVWIWNEGKELEIDRNEINFEYRKSDLPKGCVITRALFKLEKGDREKSERNIKEYLEYRNQTQPVNLANTGSIFKNPENIAAGELLEKLGLKGYRIGGAKFSELHANFIVNSGSACASDVINLIQLAKEKAIDEEGITLETEVKILGDP